jgi:hypothetical protein
VDKLIRLVRKSIGYIILIATIIFLIFVFRDDVVIEKIGLTDILVLILTIIGTIIAMRDYSARKDIAHSKYQIINKFEDSIKSPLLFFFDEMKGISKTSFVIEKDRERRIRNCNQVLEVFDMINNEFDSIFGLPYRNDQMIKKMPIHFKIKMHLLQMITILEMSEKANKKEINQLYETFMHVIDDSKDLLKEL